tara:strand:- start:24183 stop:24566 length:384 start_codon:yes stop_codon:yes gene_type:complete
MSDTSENASVTMEGLVETKYVFGHLYNLSSTFPTLVVAVPTSDGWLVRSTERSYNHDYVCYETFEEVMEWLDIDLRRPYLCRDRDEVINVLTNADSPTGFLLPGGCSSVTEEADRVLRHLETAWGVA